MINDVNGKDNTNTLLNMFIILLIIAIFIPPLFRMMYATDVKEETTTEVKGYNLECTMSETITNGVSSKTIKETVSIRYNMDQKTKTDISVTFDGIPNDSDMTELARVSSDYIYNDFEAFQNPIFSHSKNGNIDRFVAKLTDEAVKADSTVSKYIIGSTLNQQITLTQQYGFTCSKKEIK